MAGWPTVTNGSASALSIETIGAQSHQGNAKWGFDHLIKDGMDDSNDSKAQQRRLFYRIYSLYVKEISTGGFLRPFPVMLGNGKSLDLYQLFWAVKRRGGYALVSKKKLWVKVLKEMDLDLNSMPCVKLVYVKYLNEFLNWFSSVEKFRKGRSGCEGGFKSLPLELATQFRRLLSNGSNVIWEIEGLVRSESNKNGDKNDGFNEKEELKVLDTEKGNGIVEGVQSARIDDDEKNCDNDENDLAVLDLTIAKKLLGSRKRKREGIVGMLNWAKRIAVHHQDPSIRSIPKPSKGKVHEGKEFWVQLLRARGALFLKRPGEPNSESSLSKKLTMHPSMYEDNLAANHHCAEKTRCSGRLAALASSKLTNKIKLTIGDNSKVENGSAQQTPRLVDLTDPKPVSDPFADDPQRKQVSLGPEHQAEVPQWTGVVSVSDHKWLGTKIWPMKSREQKSTTEEDQIGKGKQETCCCWFPGSVQCIRFHIAEKRMKLKLDVGSAFYLWRFHCMGEEVSLQWTLEEEKKFKDLIRSEPSSLNDILRNSFFEYFKSKTSTKMVSYYFNVFVIQRRIYQNRVTPENIDSDDDETEFGSFCGFGDEAVSAQCPPVLHCSHNMQCIDIV